MIPLTLAEIGTITAGRVVGDPATLVTAEAYLDSRRPVPGGLFVAIVGERSDGHDYARGAHAVLSSRPVDAPCVVVDDPVAAVGRLARFVMQRVAPRVFAVTGSHGKTTTKDLLAGIVDGCVATPGNANNELGLPLTALALKADDRDLVVEMGARSVGDIAYLCSIAPPDVAVVTAVGSAHIGMFGSEALIARGKGELIEALSPSGTAVLNDDDPWVRRMPSPGRRMTFGRHGDVRWRGVHLDARDHTRFDLGVDGRWYPLLLQMAGLHQVRNVAAAVAAAVAAGVSVDRAVHAVASVRSNAHRMQVHTTRNGVTVIDDAYNANPHAVCAVLEHAAALARSRGRRPFAILGPMHELGDTEAESWRRVERTASRLGVTVVRVGGDDDRDDVVRRVRRQARPGDVVVCKASRAERFEQVVSALME